MLVLRYAHEQLAPLTCLVVGHVTVHKDVEMKRRLAPMASYKLARGTAQQKHGRHELCHVGKPNSVPPWSWMQVGRAASCVFQQVGRALNRSLAEMALHRAPWMEKRHQQSTVSTSPETQKRCSTCTTSSTMRVLTMHMECGCRDNNLTSHIPTTLSVNE